MIRSIVPKFVLNVPETTEEGMLYISLEYSTIIHKCCCGCGSEVCTPTDLNGWSLTDIDGIVSLYPSIGNYNLPCRSHYFIKENKVVWC